MQKNIATRGVKKKGCCVLRAEKNGAGGLGEGH
jgi:hypothetical protein